MVLLNRELPEAAKPANNTNLHKMQPKPASPNPNKLRFASKPMLQHSKNVATCEEKYKPPKPYTQTHQQTQNFEPPNPKAQHILSILTPRPPSTKTHPSTTKKTPTPRPPPPPPPKKKKKKTPRTYKPRYRTGLKKNPKCRPPDRFEGLRSSVQPEAPKTGLRAFLRAVGFRV